MIRIHLNGTSETSQVRRKARFAFNKSPLCEGAVLDCVNSSARDRDNNPVALVQIEASIETADEALVSLGNLFVGETGVMVRNGSGIAVSREKGQVFEPSCFQDGTTRE